MTTSRRVCSTRLILSNVCAWLALHLSVMRVLAPAPDASDPPDMHAFYATWLQPSWWVIAALLFGATWLGRLRA